MSKTKKIFAFAALVFFILLTYASFDISRRTTFPGSKPQLRERLEKRYVPMDSAVIDSVGEQTE